VKLVDIDKDTEGTFFRCMHDERPENPPVIELRHRWYDQYKSKCLRAKVLVRDDKAVVGLCQYIPIEHSPLTGENLFTILCFAVHGYEHLVGNQQGKGYGKFMLNSIEQDARNSGAKGMAVRAEYTPEWDKQWSTVPFYEHMGYSRVETSGPFTLMWKPFVKDAKPPSFFHPTRQPSKKREKTKVTLFLNGWCNIDCSCCVSARGAIAGIEDMVSYEEIDTSNRAKIFSYVMDDVELPDDVILPPNDNSRLGELPVVWEVFLDDAPFKPYGTQWTREDLRAEILRLSKKKNQR